MKAFVILLVVLLTTTGSPVLALQQSALPDLTLETSSGEQTLTLFVEPGESVRESLRLQSTVATEVSLDLVNLTSPPNGGIIVDDIDPPTALTTWFQLGNAGTQNLEADSSQSVDLTISVPDDTAPGQYLAAVTVSAAAVTVENSDLALTSRSTLIVSIMVPGDQRPAFSLDAPTIEQSAFGTVLVIPIANTGNLSLAPAGEITINPASGEQTTLPIQMGVLVPGVTTTIEIILPTTLAGEATLRLALADSATGVRGQLTDIPVSIPLAGVSESPDDDSPDIYTPDGEPVAVTIRNATLTPQGRQVETVIVTADIVNTGTPLGSAALVMEVRRDGQVVEKVDLVEFESISQATLRLTFTYEPKDGFSPGLWTFRLQLTSVDPAGEVIAQTGTIGKLDIP